MCNCNTNLYPVFCGHNYFELPPTLEAKRRKITSRQKNKLQHILAKNLKTFITLDFH